MGQPKVSDPGIRRVSRMAALIAVPVALATGGLVFWQLDRATNPGPRLPSVQATGPVRMDAPALSTDAAVACRALLSHLPDSLGDRPRRPVTAGPEQNAAYGDPPITLACGLGTPSVPPTDEVTVLDGVCWYAAPDKSGTTWYTLDRVVPITVRIPAAYQHSAERAIDFSAPIAGSVKSLTADRLLPGCQPNN
jgi:hypothetical protein